MEIRELSDSTHNLLHPAEEFPFADYPDDVVIGEHPRRILFRQDSARVTGITTTADGFTLQGRQFGTDEPVSFATNHTHPHVLPPHLRLEIAHQVRAHQARR